MKPLAPFGRRPAGADGEMPCLNLAIEPHRAEIGAQAVQDCVGAGAVGRGLEEGIRGEGQWGGELPRVAEDTAVGKQTVHKQVGP